jgi:hypothetical protein
MTEYQLKIVFVLVLCAPVAYFGIRFFMSLVSSAVAGRKMPERRKTGREGGPDREEGVAPERRRRRRR